MSKFGRNDPSNSRQGRNKKLSKDRDIRMRDDGKPRRFQRAELLAGADQLVANLTAEDDDLEEGGVQASYTNDHDLSGQMAQLRAEDEKWEGFYVDDPRCVVPAWPVNRFAQTYDGYYFDYD